MLERRQKIYIKVSFTSTVKIIVTINYYNIIIQYY